jgi:hypothetical protein
VTAARPPQIITAHLGDRQDGAAERKRRKARERQRRLRRRRNGDRHVFTVSVVVDYPMVAKLQEIGFLDQRDEENRDAVAAALQNFHDQWKKYE